MHPVLFRWGTVVVTGFFVFAVLAFAAAAFLAVRRARAADLSGPQLGVLGAATLLSFVGGARLSYLLIYWDYYRRHSSEVFRIQEGGLTFVGGLLAAFLAVSVLLRFYRKPVFPTINRMIPPLVLAQAIARIGCFLQGCCYGDLTGRSWGVVYPSETVRRHPVQLYESGALFLLFFLLLRLERSKRRTGTNLLWYGLLYGLYRSAADFLRADSVNLAAGLKLSQWIALLLVFLCGFLLIRRDRSCTPSS